VDLGLLNTHSIFEFTGHDPTHLGDGFAFSGSITESEVATAAVPEAGSMALMGSGLLALSALRHRRGQSASNFTPRSASKN
jgi:hypothetical protein